MASLTIKHINKTYLNGTTALSDFNLTVDKGDFLVLIGPSGCGKTTLLRIIAGLEKLSSGSITLDGRDIASLSPKTRNIAMVFQNYTLFPHFNVFNNIAFPLKINKTAKEVINDKVNEVGEMLSITHLFQRRPKELSGGEKQRVAIARAILRKPQLFLFDEPFSNLDNELRQTMRTELKRIQKRLGITTIYVTHDQSEAMTLGSRLAVMKEGRIVQQGEPKTVYSSPNSLFSARFTGKVNCLQGELVIVNKKTAFILSKSMGEETPLFTTESACFARKAASFINNPLTLAIRPEDIYYQEREDTSGMIRIKCTFFQEEWSGFDAISRFCLDKSVDDIIYPEQQNMLSVRSSPDNNFKSGDSCNLYLNPDKVFLFPDPDKPGPNT